MQAEVAWSIRTQLGEGPIWWEGSLYWVDLIGATLHVYTPGMDQRQSYTLQEQIGTVVPRASGGVILAQETGLRVFDPSMGMIVETQPWPSEHPIVERFNDGKCDPQGRLWVGTMGRDKPIASLYRVEPGCRVTEMISGVRISNGLCWDEARGRFYYIDSPTGTVDIFDWDPAAGEISRRRVLSYVSDFETGVPDGMTIDTDGRLWVAVFGGFGVHCIDPDTGRSLEKIQVPAAKTTACWFGGEHLNELYITTASIREDEASLRANPEAGSLFVCRPGATGRPTTPCAI